MLQIDDTLISFDLLDRHFVCDLDSCRGACCIEGDEGAPLEQSEIAIIESILPAIWDKLSEAAKQIIESQGVSYLDRFGEAVTSIVKNADCVFACYDEKGICGCAIEQAYREGKVAFPKPISCHLYPVRVQKFNTMTALNYHEWNICHCARLLGRKEQIPVYQFLKEPLIRRFGAEWYEKLEFAAEELKER
jgi:hypothetical protein